LSLSKVRWIDLPHVTDERGTLTSIESGIDIPFEIRRIFYVHRVAAERGGHAHRATHQVLVPIAGELRVDLSDGGQHRSHRLGDADRGLYVPPMIWTRLHGFSTAAVLLVVADTHYDASQSLRTWDDFVRAVGAGAGPGG
jgi:dTDP-4-dehydrorhamnose 3,5-epimerase-like enzyme